MTIHHQRLTREGTDEENDVRNAAAAQRLMNWTKAPTYARSARTAAMLAWTCRVGKLSQHTDRQTSLLCELSFIAGARRRTEREN